MDSLYRAAFPPGLEVASPEEDCMSGSAAPSDRALACPAGTVSDGEPCLFCGIVLLASDKKKRCKTQASIRDFVVDFCRPTSFIYPFFANLKGDRRVPLCIACVNWQRRCSKGQRKRCNGRKPMLLMDHFVAFMLEPGKTMVPDQRCALRLVRALLAALDSGARPTGRLLDRMPVQVQVMVSGLPRDVTGETLLPQLVKAWWEFNGRSVFFAHNLTAKLVRKMIKVF